MELLEREHTFPRSQEYIEKLVSRLGATGIDDTFALQTGVIILRNAVDEDAVERAFQCVNFVDRKFAADAPLKRSGQYNYLTQLGTNNNSLFEAIGSIQNDTYDLSRGVKVQYNEYTSLDGKIASGGFHADTRVASPVILMGVGLGCTAFVSGDAGIVHGNDADKLDFNRSPHLDDRCEALNIAHIVYSGRDLVVATQPQRLHAGQTIADVNGVHHMRRTIVVVGRKH